MKATYFLPLLVLPLLGLSACKARVDTSGPAVEEKKDTTVINPPAEKKVETNTTIVNPSSGEKK